MNKGRSPQKYFIRIFFKTFALARILLKIRCSIITNDPRCNNKISWTGRRSWNTSGNDNEVEKRNGGRGQR